MSHKWFVFLLISFIWIFVHAESPFLKSTVSVEKGVYKKNWEKNFFKDIQLGEDETCDAVSIAVENDMLEEASDLDQLVERIDEVPKIIHKKRKRTVIRKKIMKRKRDVVYKKSTDTDMDVIKDGDQADSDIIAVDKDMKIITEKDLFAVFDDEIADDEMRQKITDEDFSKEADLEENVEDIVAEVVKKLERKKMKYHDNEAVDSSFYEHLQKQRDRMEEIRKKRKNRRM